MNRFKFLAVFSILAVVFFFGCQDEMSIVTPGIQDGSNSVTGQTFMKTGRGEVWADGELFGTVVTPASFKPTSGPFDEFYNGTFKNGVGHISESKPGDRDYNGGRWHVNVLKDGVDPAKYSDADSIDDLDLNDFEGTSTYFECPLLPRK